jgi:hypothetical protein
VALGDIDEVILAAWNDHPTASVASLSQLIQFRSATLNKWVMASRRFTETHFEYISHGFFVAQKIRRLQIVRSIAVEDGPGSSLS